MTRSFLQLQEMAQVKRGIHESFIQGILAKATLTSIARGEVLYDTYCAACHG